MVEVVCQTLGVFGWRWGGDGGNEYGDGGGGGGDGGGGGGGGDEYDDGGRGWVVCQGICGGAMLEVTTPIICLGLEAII